MIEVPRTERRVRQKPVFKEVEEIVELPKIRYIEAIVEVEVPFHKIEEVPEVISTIARDQGGCTPPSRQASHPRGHP